MPLPGLIQEPFVALHVSPMSRALAPEERRTIQEESEFDFGEAWDAYSELDSTVGALANIQHEGKFELDPEFGPEQFESVYQELKDDVPLQFRDRFEEARSEQHMRWIHSQIQHEQALQDRVGKMGWKGALVRLGANLWDDGMGPTLALAAGPVGMAHKATRLKAAVQGALVAGAEGVAYETILHKGSKTHAAENILYAGIFSAALGGGLGAATWGIGRNVEEAGQVAAERSAREVDQGIIEEAKGNIYPTLDTLPEDNALRQVMQHEGVEFAAESLPERPSDSMGAMRAIGEGPLGEDVPRDIMETPYTAFGNARASIAAQFGRDKNPYIRWLGWAGVEDAVGRKGTDLNPVAASERASRITKVAEAKWGRASNIEFRNWRKERGYNYWDGKRPSVRQEFLEEVVDHIEHGTSTNPAVQRSAKAWSEAIGDVHEAARRAGVKGFDEFQHRADYVPHIMSASRMRTWVARMGNDGLVRELVADGIRRAQPELEDKLVTKLSDKYVRSVRERQAGVREQFSISGDNRALLRELLEDVGMDEDEIDNILTTVAGKETDAGRTGRAKRRVLMDTSASKEVTYTDPDTGQLVTREVKLSELMDRNAESLLQGYVRSVGGLASIAQRTKGTSRHITSRRDWEKVLNEAKKWEDYYGNRNPNEAARKVKMLEDTYKMMTGQPIEDPLNPITRTLRRSRDWNVVRLMNQVFFAQAVEFGGAMAHGGLRAMVQQMPVLKDIFRRAQTGELSNQLLDELEAWVGMGTDWIRNTHLGRFDDASDFGPEYFTAFDHTLNQMKRVTSAPMHTLLGFQQRSLMAVMSQKMANLAHGARMSKSLQRRLEFLGLGERERQLVFDNIKAHADTTTSGLTGRNLNTLNLENWDPDARDLFSNAMFRTTRRIIQENDIGMLPMFMHKEVGKTVFQFRSFIMGAHEAQLLHNLRHADFEAFSMVMLTTMIGAVMHTMQTYANSVGREDAEEYRRERMGDIENGEWRTLALSAWQRTGWSSLLPAAADTLNTGVFQNDPLFHGRSTGLATDIISGAPTLDLGDKVHRAGSAILQQVPRMVSDRPDYEFTDYDFYNLHYSLAFANMLGVKQFMQAWGSTFPDK